MFWPKRSLQQTVAYLNDLCQIDPLAIETLVNYRTPCNQELADHPTVQVAPTNMVGMLGILNGLFGLDSEGSGGIGVEYDDYDRLTGFYVIESTKKVIAISFGPAAENCTEYRLTKSGALELENLFNRKIKPKVIKMALPNSEPDLIRKWFSLLEVVTCVRREDLKKEIILEFRSNGGINEEAEEAFSKTPNEFTSAKWEDLMTESEWAALEKKL